MKLYQKLFASKYDTFMVDLETKFHTIRQELTEKLEGEILDVESLA